MITTITSPLDKSAWTFFQPKGIYVVALIAPCIAAVLVAKTILNGNLFQNANSENSATARGFLSMMKPLAGAAAFLLIAGLSFSRAMQGKLSFERTIPVVILTHHVLEELKCLPKAFALTGVFKSLKELGTHTKDVLSLYYTLKNALQLV